MNTMTMASEVLAATPSKTAVAGAVSIPVAAGMLVWAVLLWWTGRVGFPTGAVIYIAGALTPALAFFLMKLGLTAWNAGWQIAENIRSSSSQSVSMPIPAEASLDRPVVIQLPTRR